MYKRLTAMILALALSLSVLTPAAWAAEAPAETEEQTAAAEGEAPAAEEETPAEEETAEPAEELPVEPEVSESEEELPAGPETTEPEEETTTEDAETPTEAPETPTEEPETPTEAPETPTEEPEPPAEEPETLEEAQPVAEASVDPDEGVMTASTTASGAFGDNNVTWTLDSSGTLTISGTGEMPSWWHSSSSPGWSSYRSEIKKVVIEYGVTTIGNYAFMDYDNLTSVTVPSSVTSIGSYAFWSWDGLTSLTIPSGVTTVGDHAFADCDSLISVTIPSNVKSIEACAFNNCNNLTSVTIRSGVTTIGSSAFGACGSLTSVTIQNGVTTIGDYAFNDCDSLTSVTIPASVTDIGVEPFNDCDSLIEIIVDGNNSVYTSVDGVLYNKNKTILIICPCHKAEITIPASVTVIGGDAFAECNSLTNVTIPSNVATIGAYAFHCCDSLTNVTIRHGVTTIGDSAFKECDSLTSVTIPASVKSIGDYAFDYCDSLTSVIIQDGVMTIGLEAFYNCDSLTSVTIPDSVTTIGEYAFGYVYYKKAISGFAIKGYSSSAAQTYAKENSFTFVTLWRYLSSCTIALSKSAYTCDGSAKKPTVTVKNGRKTLKSGTDYTISYSNNTNVGTAKVTVTGKGSYTGTVTKTFQIGLATPTLSKAENTSDGVKLKWTKVPGCSGYNIYRRASGDSYSKIAVVRGVDNLTYTDGSASSGTAYDYQIYAFYSSYKSGTSSKTIIRLSTPVLSKTSNLSSGIKLTWTKATGCSGYNIYRRPYGGSYSKIAVVKGTSNLTYTDTGVKGGTTYVYRVVAYAGKSVSDYESQTITCLSVPTISKLENLSGGVKVAWKKTSGCSGYNIYRRAYGGSYSKIAVVKGASNLTYTDKSAKSGTTYVYRVIAYSGNSVSAYESKTIYRLTAPAVTLTSPQKKWMKVSWNKVSGIGGYQYQVSTSTDFSKAGTYSLASGKTSFTVGSLTSGKTYCVRMRTYKTVNGTKYYSAWSAVKSVRIK